MILDKILSFIKSIFFDSINKITNPVLVQLRTLFFWIGIFSVIVFVFITTQNRVEIETYEGKIEDLNGEVKKYEKIVSEISDENEKKKKEISNLQDDLKKLQNKSNDYKKKYEKQVDYINSLSSSQLTKLFTKEFKNQ